MKTEEVFDLPNTNEIPVKIPVTKMYNEFKKHHIIEIGEELLIGDTPAAKKLYLRQLAGVITNINYNTSNLIESTNDRIIIFYNFKRNIWHWSI